MLLRRKTWREKIQNDRRRTTSADFISLKRYCVIEKWICNDETRREMDFSERTTTQRMRFRIRTCVRQSCDTARYNGRTTRYNGRTTKGKKVQVEKRHTSANHMSNARTTCFAEVERRRRKKDSYWFSTTYYHSKKTVSRQSWRHFFVWSRQKIEMARRAAK